MACCAFKLQDMCLKGIPLDVILLNIAAATTILSLFKIFCDVDFHDIGDFIVCLDGIPKGRFWFGHETFKRLNDFHFLPLRALDRIYGVTVRIFLWLRMLVKFKNHSSTPSFAKEMPFATTRFRYESYSTCRFG
ncbi:hypothetical protein RRG08_021859 [Elysia crispata]|uniref:Uncharacterized protein n=1 Tax=Elysia crispata TaxID=231223 RepID=A0AAE1D3Q0_9GAST|nr:hypothetical protein RRG08_021859 [Elysia crispata]